MGVYIRGMEMPKGLEMLVVFSDGTVHKCLPGIKETLERSTAVPVLPHGRLIDADALISDGFYTVVCYTGKMPYAFTAMRIADAPTIIPAEEDE